MQARWSVINPAFTIWLTGLPGAGKTTIGQALAKELEKSIGPVALLDGDDIRRLALYTLGFSREDRDLNIRAIAFVARTLNFHGVPAIVAAVSPYAATRREAREMMTDFIEVHVDCPIEVCIERDPKGLYAKALAGEIPNMTGIDDPYEEPLNPELTVATDELTADDAVAAIIDRLSSLGLVE